jgi:hypothetical protein
VTQPDDLVERARKHLAEDETHLAALRAAARMATRLHGDANPELSGIGSELWAIVAPAIADPQGEVWL